jgi:hypothetical protein
VRPLRLRDLPRLRRRLRNWSKGPGGFREERPNLFVLSPIVLPGPYSRIATRVNRFLLLRSIRRWMRTLGVSRPIAWTFLPTPLAHQLIDSLDPALTIYYCIDDLASSSPEARRIVSSEESMFRRADSRFRDLRKLRRRAATFSSRVHLFPFGVKYDSSRPFASRRAARRPTWPGSNARSSATSVDCIMDRSGSRGRDGGAVSRCKFRVRWPPQCDLTRLESTANVKLLGAKPHAELPHYVREFDVGIVPYRLEQIHRQRVSDEAERVSRDGHSRGGKRSGGDPAFNAEHGEIVGDRARQQRVCCRDRRAIDDGSADAVRRRLAVARANSWPSRINQMTELITGAMATRAEAGRAVGERLASRLPSRAQADRGSVLAILLTYLLFFQTPFVWLLAKPLEGGRAAAAGGLHRRLRRRRRRIRESRRRIPGTCETGSGSLSLGYAVAWSSRRDTSLRFPNRKSCAPWPSTTASRHRRSNWKHGRQHARERGVLAAHPQRPRVEARVAGELAVSHAPRFADLANRGARHHAVATPAPNSQFYAHDRGASLEQMRGIAQEYAAIVMYWWRGWI